MRFRNELFVIVILPPDKVLSAYHQVKARHWCLNHFHQISRAPQSSSQSIHIDLTWSDLTWLDFDLLLLVLAIWTTSWNRANLKIIGWAQLPFVILEIPYSHFRPWIWLGNNLWNNKLKINTDWLTEPLTLNWIECEWKKDAQLNSLR